MTIQNVAYGIDTENGKEYFYVQTACSDEHGGQNCDCKDIAHYDNLEQAKEHAEQLGKLLNVPVQYDNECNEKKDIILYMIFDTNDELVFVLDSADRLIYSAEQHFQGNYEYYESEQENEPNYKTLLSDDFEFNSVENAIKYWNISDHYVRGVRSLCSLFDIAESLDLMPEAVK